MTAASGIKRLGIALAGIVVVIWGGLSLLSYLVPADAVREAVKNEIHNVTGLDLVLRGDTSVSLFPAKSISFENISLGEDSSGGAALTAERLVARLRFFPMLMGRFEIADVSLVHPTVTLALASDGHWNWASQLDALARTLKPATERLVSFSEINISDGTIIVRDDKRQVVDTLTRMNLALAWPSISKSFAANGSLTWHGETLNVAASLSDFLAGLTGDRSGIKVRVSGNPLKLAFDGYLSARPTLRMEGTLSASADSLRDTLRWTGQEPLPGGGFGRFGLKAAMNVAGGTVALSNANVELDGNVAEGVLSFATGGRQILQGTLATDTLDLTPYVSTMRLLASATDRDWNRLPIRLDGLTGTDADLRLSAAKVTVGNAKLGRTAVGANLRDGKLTISVGESHAFDGVIQGSLALANANDGASLSARLQFTGVDMEQALGEMFNIRRLQGTGNLAFNVAASGASVFSLVKSLNGTASLTAGKGAILGLNIEQLLRRLEQRPLSGSGDFRSGQTPFDGLNLNIRIADGNAFIETVHIDGPGVRLALAGSASIPERDLDLKGTASLLKGGSKSDPIFDLPFVVRGSWDDPLMLPDAEILIRRSGAAAPLLDSLHDRLPKALQGR